MNTDLAIRGALAGLQEEAFSEAALLRELQAHGLAGDDGMLAVERAVLDGYVTRTASGVLVKLPRARAVAVPEHLPQP